MVVDVQILDMLFPETFPSPHNKPELIVLALVNDAIGLPNNSVPSIFKLEKN